MDKQQAEEQIAEAKTRLSSRERQLVELIEAMIEMGKLDLVEKLTRSGKLAD